MQRKAKDNPVDRLPDWHTTLPLAQAVSLWRTQPEGQPMPRACHAERALPNARGQEHRSPNIRGVGTDAPSEYETWVVFGGNTADHACDPGLTAWCAADAGRDVAVGTIESDCHPETCDSGGVSLHLGQLTESAVVTTYATPSD